MEGEGVGVDLDIATLGIRDEDSGRTPAGPQTQSATLPEPRRKGAAADDSPVGRNLELCHRREVFMARRGGGVGEGGVD